jgi:hypothetical protein
MLVTLILILALRQNPEVPEVVDFRFLEFLLAQFCPWENVV